MRMSAWLMLGLLVTTIACSHKPPADPQDYVAAVTAARAAKDKEFQSSDDPIPTARHAIFLPLLYYPIDPDYNVAAALKVSDQQPIVKMPTSTGTLRDMRRVGTLEFMIKGQPCTLSAFTEDDLRRLFVPFSDLTSGKETYPAGRFIDLTRTGTNLYALDFNTAYNPTCYYNASYECPLPPPENRLKIAILAGEKTKPHE
jgi:uncharacterized protein (DUF1684 family)